jgi:hypothetical protein
MEVLYYGENNGKKYMFNLPYINNIIITQLASKESHYSYSFEYFTNGTKNFVIFLKDTIRKVGTSSGCTLKTTAQGTRSKTGGNARKTIKKNKTRTNSKTRKMRKIRKHKFTKRMKKSNRHKRSRK